MHFLVKNKPGQNNAIHRFEVYGKDNRIRTDLLHDIHADHKGEGRTGDTQDNEPEPVHGRNLKKGNTEMLCQQEIHIHKKKAADHFIQGNGGGFMCSDKLSV